MRKKSSRELYFQFWEWFNPPITPERLPMRNAGATLNQYNY
jgi:hypothetical protein